MTTDVDQFISDCKNCQQAKRPHAYKQQHNPVGTLPIPDKPNERVHIDLFGPLKRSEGGKAYILVMTDAFSKYAELAVVSDKTAEQVGTAFFEKWICKFSVPKRVISDRGPEFCSELSEKLYSLLGLQHVKTAAYNPKCNSAAESFNRQIIKYLRAYMEENDTLSWEKFLPALALAYNTAIHKSTMQSPFFLTFLHEPNLPFFDAEREQKFYTDDFAVAAYLRLQKAYATVKENILDANLASQRYNNAKAKTVRYAIGEEVLVAFPSRNREGNIKLEKVFKSGFVITQTVGEFSYIVKNLKTRRSHIVNADLLQKLRKNKEVSQECQSQEEGKSYEENEKSQGESSQEGEENKRLTRSQGSAPHLPHVQPKILERKARREQDVSSQE